MLSLSPAKLLVVLVVALIVLGPEKLPQVARQLGAFWGDVRKWRERLESEVRSTFPDLPATHEVVQAVRSPLSFLDRLADAHEDSRSGASNGSDRSNRSNGSDSSTEEDSDASVARAVGNAHDPPVPKRAEPAGDNGQQRDVRGPLGSRGPARVASRSGGWRPPAPSADDSAWDFDDPNMN